MSSPESKKSNLFSWSSHGVTDTGKVRKHNEDAMLERPDIGLWIVADGMGGHAAGDVASGMIIESLQKIDKDIALSRVIDDIEDRLLQVNLDLIGRAQANKKWEMVGSTVVLMLAYEKYCTYIWAGDSRMYRLRNDQLGQMTTDHSQVQEYVEQGLISREDALIHPHGNMITRAIGATNPLFLDMDIQELRSGDRYLLCSDGLTKHVSDIEFQDILKEGDTGSVCAELIDRTLARGGTDNVTVITVDIK